MENKLEKLTILFVVLAVGLGIVVPTEAAVVTRGPYVQNSSPNAMTIMWRTDVNTTGRVWYGTDLGNLDQIETGQGPVITHQIRLTALLTDTPYYYQVGTDANEVLAGGAV